MATTQHSKASQSSGSNDLRDISAHPAPSHTSGEHVPCWFSVGSAASKMPTFPKLTENVRVDTCVVGGGIVGITTAYLLAKKGKTVCLLEDGEIASGETGRTTAHLAPALDDRFYNLIKTHGKKYAQQAYQSHAEALDFIEQVCKDEGIECEFERVPEYLFKHEEEQNDPSELDKEFSCMQELEIPNVKMINRAPISAYDTKTCIQVDNQGQFHPLLYMAGLTKATAKLGVRIHTNTHAQDFISSKEGTQVKTIEGFTVMCSSLVQATNVPLTNLLTIHAKQEPYR